MSLALELLDMALDRVEELERELAVPRKVRMGDAIIFDTGGSNGGHFKVTGWGYPHSGVYLSVLELRLERA
jgi:hypothetical protein